MAAPGERSSYRTRGGLDVVVQVDEVDEVGAVQELVDRPDWSSGNAVVLLVSGSGSRVAESYNGGAGVAPELVIDYMP